MTCPRLIEVTLPIREISSESVRDKSLRHGHISTLHMWWARRPLAASRAVVFASLVPDPDHAECPPEFRDAVTRLLKTNVASNLKSYYNGKRQVPDRDPYKPYKNLPDTPRNRLLTFIAKWSPEKIAFDSGKPLEGQGKVKAPKPDEMLDDRCLVKWETSDPANEQGHEILRIARELVRIANGGQVPVVLDPFSGGGAIPLEATRLGAQAIANDYNPVAYLILRATCEFPQKYGKPGTRVVERTEYGSTASKEMLVENVLTYDVEYWAKWILERTKEKIGHLYPPGKDGKPVVGYLWARTAPCSNPTCRAEIPLLRSLYVCNREGKRVALTLTVKGKEVVFGVARNKDIKGTAGTMIEKGRGAVMCPVCKQVTPVEDLRRAGLDGNMGERMTAVITDTPQGKDYRAVEESDLRAFEKAKLLTRNVERPSEEIPANQWNIKTWLYGMNTWGSLYNARQLIVMQTLIGFTHEAVSVLQNHSLEMNYQTAIAAYLGLWVSRISARASTLGLWNPGGENVEHPFGRQAIPIVWDFPEANILGDSSGGAIGQLDWILRVLEHESSNASSALHPARVILGDGASLLLKENEAAVVVTDPPYFDAIAYADLSDYFYIWLKRSLSEVFPEAFVTPLTPKSNEATAFRHRHDGDAEKAKEYFTAKLAGCFAEAKRICRLDGVVVVMFAHQSTEAWSSLVDALFGAGLNVVATFPIDTERTTALKREMSALASSITVVCRAREVGAAASFRDVRREIEKVVTESVRRFFDVYGFRGADLIVACYGPAVGVFGKYERVERADGTPVTVAELLALVREIALKAIAGEFEGDNLSRLYFVWANLYGVGEQAWDDARLVVQIGGDAESAMEVAKSRGVFEVDGSSVRLALLADRDHKKHLGDDRTDPLIDQLHHAMRLWKGEDRAGLVEFLWKHDLLENNAFWKLAQALFEVLPRDTDDWKLISALLSERETFKTEAKQGQRQDRLFDA
ncbi:MAG: DUF1156 domain-containing protein [Anaerolineae bacterium]|nr:DUF1156 domain-containing protein [Anaerolineae bacterium]